MYSAKIATRTTNRDTINSFRLYFACLFYVHLMISPLDKNG